MNEIATYIALALVVLFLVGVVGLMVWRAAMAKLELRVPKGKIQPGEEVDVTLCVQARRPLRWQRIVLSLTCIERRDDAQPLEVYRDDVVVTGEGQLSPGALAEYSATFVAPERFAARGVEISLPETLEGVLAPLADAASRYRARDFNWRISADVESDLVLSTSRRLDLTLAPTRHEASPSGQSAR